MIILGGVRVHRQIICRKSEDADPVNTAGWTVAGTKGEAASGGRAKAAGRAPWLLLSRRASGCALGLSSLS